MLNDNNEDEYVIIDLTNSKASTVEHVTFWGNKLGGTTNLDDAIHFSKHEIDKYTGLSLQIFIVSLNEAVKLSNRVVRIERLVEILPKQLEC